jgi:hypothetical protein
MNSERVDIAGRQKRGRSSRATGYKRSRVSLPTWRVTTQCGLPQQSVALTWTVALRHRSEADDENSFASVTVGVRLLKDVEQVATCASPSSSRQSTSVTTGRRDVCQDDRGPAHASGAADCAVFRLEDEARRGQLRAGSRHTPVDRGSSKMAS